MILVDFTRSEVKMVPIVRKKIIIHNFIVACSIPETGGTEVELASSSSSSRDEMLSEFTSTPNTSTHSTLVTTPDKEGQEEHIIMDVPFPENPKSSVIAQDKKVSKGKDLNLIKRQNEQCPTPSDSLYFSMMTRTKQTARLNKSIPKGKQPQTPIPATPLKKASPKSVN